MNVNLLKILNSIEAKNVEPRDKKESLVNNENNFKSFLKKQDNNKSIEKNNNLKDSNSTKLKDNNLEKNVEVSLDNKIPMESLENLQDIELKEDIMSILNICLLIQTLAKDFKSLEDGSESLKEFNVNLDNITLNLNLLTKELDSLNSLENNLLEENKSLESGLLNRLKKELSKEDFSKIENLILKTDIDFKSLKENGLESLVKGLININDYSIKDEKIIEGYTGNKKEDLKNIILNIEDDIKNEDKNISLKDLINGLENLERLNEKKEGIENLGEIKPILKEEKPFDIKVQGKEESAIKEKNEEEVLSSILNKDNKENMTLFNNKLEALNKTIKGDEAVILRKSNINTDLIKSVKYMNINGVKELTVKVYPRDLGEIIISISKEDEVLKANLKANSKDTFNLISQNSSEIKKLLNENGIKISDVDISLYEDTTFYNENEFNKDRNENNKEHKFNYENESLELESSEESEEDTLLNILA